MVIKKNRKKGRFYRRLAFFFLPVAAVMVMADVQLRPIIKTVIAAHAKTYATAAVNDAVTTVLAEKRLQYENLVHLTYSEAGEVSALTTDMVSMNLLQSDITAQLVRSVVDFTSRPAEVPLGSLIGGQFFSGRGPAVEIRLVPAGFVETGIRNRFESAGINQVRHSIIMTVRITLSAIIPGYSVDATVDQDVILAETVIVGLVPEAYTLVGDGTQPLVGLIQDYGAERGLVQNEYRSRDF